MFSPQQLLFLPIIAALFSIFITTTHGAAILPKDEVETLQTVFTRLQMEGVVSPSFCGDNVRNSTVTYSDLWNITCDCTHNSSTVCHVTIFQVNNQYVTGVIPEELGNLTFLQEIDIPQNYLNGTIPVSLGRLPNLVILSLPGNNLSGSIPEEIGSIATLEELVLEDNLIGGPLPRKLGNLRRLKRIKVNNQYLTGVIPEELGNLTFLQEIDLSQNYLNGTIPASLGRLPNLVILNLWGNHLSGSIPKEIGNIATLEELLFSRNNLNGTIPASLGRLPNLAILYLWGNRLSGLIPEEIGNIATLKELSFSINNLNGTIPASVGRLPNLVLLYLWGNRLSDPIPWEIGNISTLEKLDLSANNFTRPIPDSFSNLLNLTNFWIDGNNLTGRIPDFIGNWTQLETLSLRGASLEGPIPSHISSLRNLIELRISDLRGPSSSFPNLEELPNLEKLILRNCMLNGTLPPYIGNMTKLKLLDLSFNHLTGTIPDTFQNLDRRINFIFFTNNSLSGAVPQWMLKNCRDNFDLSYNNFTEKPPASCQQSQVNLVSSFSSTRSNSTPWCLMKDLPCPDSANHYSLFINCGGNLTTYKGHDYEEDKNTEGPSFFASVNNRWSYSSTGVYMVTEYNSSYIATNLSDVNVNVTGPGYYTTARIAPLSLKYYGLCMRQGSYKVQLHFAEILYSDNQTFSNHGRRIFDVSIQGQVVLENFNIAEEAGGVGIGITKPFDVNVTGSTLEIHLYWRGKGTAAVPDRGVIGDYGPLISAITVTPNFEVEPGGFSDTEGYSVGAIVGIVIASAVVVILLLVVLRMKCFRTKEVGENDFQGLDLQTGIFTLRQIKAATNNFDPANKLGEGGFGPVYKGTLSDGAIIAVKQLSSKSTQGNREFVNEIGMISALQHPNLVRLYGCCIEGNQLIYEYMENNSLARTLFGGPGKQLNLDWKTRTSICIGIARGLAYLHEESRLKIVHRDIKATNVLLDKDLNAKISDFGLAKLDEEENTHISTRIAGTIGYMAPEYAMRGYLTDKADVYSFGIVALEIVSGKSNTNYRPKEEFVYLLDWAYVLQEQGNLLDLVDPCLDSSYSTKEAKLMLNIALLCTNPSPTLRPAMSSVVSMLEGKIPAQAPIIKGNGTKQDARFRAFEILSQDSQTQVSSLYSHESQEPRSMSIDGPWFDSTVSL